MSMADDERAQNLERVRPWVMACAAFLHLDHWTIHLRDEEPGDGARAQIRRWNGQLDCNIYLGGDFFETNEREQREAVAHEFLHAHMRPMWDVWYDLDELLGKPAYTLLRNHANIAEEQVVDALAKVVGSLLPPPLSEEDGESMGESKSFMCGIVSVCGPNGEPLACAYPPAHEGDHSWATISPFIHGKVAELIQGAIESTDNTPRTARLRKALEAFGVDNRDALARGVHDQARAFCEAKGLPYARSEVEGGRATIWFDEGSSVSGRWPDVLDTLSRIKVDKE